MGFPLFVWPGIAAMICFLTAAGLAMKRKFKYHKPVALTGIVLAIVHIAMAMLGVY